MQMAQTRMILDHLKQHRSITPLDALKKYGCFRLGARIYDLRAAGHQIHTKMIEVGRAKKRVASYRLVKLAKDAA